MNLNQWAAKDLMGFKKGKHYIEDENGPVCSYDVFEDKNCRRICDCSGWNPEHDLNQLFQYVVPEMERRSFSVKIMKWFTGEVFEVTFFVADSRFPAIHKNIGTAVLEAARKAVEG